MKTWMHNQRVTDVMIRYYKMQTLKYYFDLQTEKNPTTSLSRILHHF